MNFGQTLKYLRKKIGLTQKELAEELKLGYSTIGQYELNTREPGFNNLQKIKDYFNVSYDFLLDENQGNKEDIKKIELDIIDLISVLRKNYITINGEQINEKAKEGLIRFLKYYGKENTNGLSKKSK